MITILFPGGFKPMHGGHIHLIEQYLKLDNIKEIKVLIGSGIRGGIDRIMSIEIAKKLISNDKISLEFSNYLSPILTSYKFIETANPGIYAMLGSKKDNDYTRVIDFVNGYSASGKYHKLKPNNVEIIELSIDIEPLKYIKRTDKNNGNYISSSILRDDVLNNDFENFKTNYPNHNIDIIQNIWNLIK